MGTLYIDRKNIHVKLDGNALAFYINGQRGGAAPITPLKRIIVVGNVTFETPVIHRLAGENITVIFLSGRRLRFCGMLHGRLHNNGLLRVRQYEKSLDGRFTATIACEIVKRKITAQTDLLKDALSARPDLRFSITAAINTLAGIMNSLLEISSTLKAENAILSEGIIDSLRGYEGSAAAAYFSAYTSMFADSLNFRNRNRRPPRDPVNAVLSLSYTLLHHEVLREAEVTGLDPVIGFYHQFKYGRESLACDLVELFRHEIDRFVWTIFRERIFTARDFVLEVENQGCYLAKGARSRFYPLYEEWARKMRASFTVEARSIAQKITDGSPFWGE